ncbi:MAG TPA: helix-turn-helix domain-containing protein, partial [Bacillales bacterium]
IPEEMIELADRYSFPLIVFQKEVRFIDITQDLNGLLVETHYKMMSDLESFSNQLNHLLLSTSGFHKILRLLHKYLDVQVVYLPVEGEPTFFPVVEEADREALMLQINSKQKVPIASQTIQALGHIFADLMIFSETRERTEFDSLVLDRTATALAQEQLRVLHVEEKRKYKENRWVQGWLSGDHQTEEIKRHLSTLEPLLKFNGCVVCYGEFNLTEGQADFTYYYVVFRSIFEQQGFFLLTSYEGNQVIFALVNQRDRSDWKERVSRALAQIQSTEFIREEFPKPIYFGVGKMFAEPDCLHQSYQMAREALDIQRRIGKTDKPFYDELYIYRFISLLNRQDNLQEFISDHIGSLLAFDREHQSQMFETLKVFLEVNGSKKEAAKRLYIVRQTLYHRIERLKELLGEDFMEPEKRMAIEFAIYAREFTEKEVL